MSIFLYLTVLISSPFQNSEPSYLAIVGADIHTVSDGLIQDGIILCKIIEYLKLVSVFVYLTPRK